MAQTYDLTRGNPTKLILTFFFPMLFTNMLQQIYSIADTAIVGKGLGDDALAAVDMTAFMTHAPHLLSGGQKQRVAIARALINEPQLLLADEPTGNLDSRASNSVMEELKKVHEEGNTIIMVTHNPALTMYATRVINMLDGQIDTDIKTVEDHNLPQPIEVKRGKAKKRKNTRKNRRKN